MLSNKKIRYEDDWDGFIRKIRRFSPKQRKALMEEALYAGNLTMIVALSADYLHAYSTNDARSRLHNQMLRMQEQRRLTPNPDAIRNYIDEGTKAMMPTIIVASIVVRKVFAFIVVFLRFRFSSALSATQR